MPDYEIDLPDSGPADSAPFPLDPALERDTHHLARLDLCDVRLMDDQSYPWLVLVPRVEGAVEILDLSADQRAVLMEEIAQAGEALRTATRCDKLNIAALGTQVRQLHVHVIARNVGDAAWPAPVWGHTERAPYQHESRDALAQRIVMSLGG